MAPVQRDHPNFVIIHCHDLGKNLGCYGAGVDTPNIDELSRDGATFERAFASAPQCSPSRGSIMTGKHPHNNGLMGLTHHGWELNEDERTLPMYLREEGYQTQLIGYQHEADDPKDLGYQNNTPRKETPETVAERATNFFEERDDGDPFFASIGFFEPHRPFRVSHVNDEAYDVYDPDEIDLPSYLPDHRGIREDFADFWALISATIDPAVGRITSALQRTGLEEETVVVFTTDHGAAMPRAKGTCYDPGIETALIVSSPERFASGTRHDELISNVDLLPTLLEIAGRDPPPEIDGRSFLPLLQDDGENEPRSEIYAELTWHSQYNPIRSIRTEQFKYIRNFADVPDVFLPSDVFDSKAGAEVRQEYYSNPRPAEELYDLTEDPDERNNLASDRRVWEIESEGPAPQESYEHVLESLRSDLRMWMEETDDPLLDGPVASPNSNLDDIFRDN